MALFVKLDTRWASNRKLIRCSLAARGMHAILLCIAKGDETDGWVDQLILNREKGDTESALAELAAVGLIEVDGDMVRALGWHERNPSQDAIEAMRTEKAMAGKRGNHSRWHEGPIETCSRCFPQVIAECDRSESQTETDTSRLRSPESETELEEELRPTPLTSQSAIPTDALARIRSQVKGSPDAARIALSAIRGEGNNDKSAPGADPVGVSADTHVGATA